MSDLDILIQQSAIPDEAQMQLDEFTKLQPAFNPRLESHRLFARIFGNSRFLGHFALRHPEILPQFSEGTPFDATKSIMQLQQELASLNTNTSSSLHDFKYTAYIRYTVRELTNRPSQATYREIADLAQAITGLQTEIIQHKLCTQYNLTTKQLCPFAILGMGKLGGGELNYSSDIDLIGFYDIDTTYESVTSHEFFVKLFSQLSAALSRSNENGFLFRTDWDLRPEGVAGTMANSFSAMETYYTTFGAEWERQAYIKANPVYQTNKLGDEFLRLMSSFVFRKAFDEKTIKNTWDMKHRIVTELNQKPSKGINIKLDHGGIRDVEFFAQGFQLLYGGTHPNLRTRNTLDTLEQIAMHGLVPQDKINILKSGYMFLRRLESCLQMENEQQTHVFVNEPRFKLKQARRMGITLPENDAVSLIEEELHTTRTAIKQVFDDYYKG